MGSDARHGGAIGFDAVILAGGRSSRLGGGSKASLTVAGRTLLELTRAAAAEARAVVVVGDAVAGLSGSVRFAREEPAFGGPAAALEAGIRELGRGAPRSEWVLVLACDMPRIADAVPALQQALGASASDLDGVIALDHDGRRQYLAAVYRTDSLAKALAQLDPLEGVAMRAVVSGLTLQEVAVTAGSTVDIDTWADAERAGATR